MNTNRRMKQIHRVTDVKLKFQKCSLIADAQDRELYFIFVSMISEHHCILQQGHKFEEGVCMRNLVKCVVQYEKLQHSDRQNFSHVIH